MVQLADMCFSEGFLQNASIQKIPALSNVQLPCVLDEAAAFSWILNVALDPSSSKGRITRTSPKNIETGSPLCPSKFIFQVEWIASRNPVFPGWVHRRGSIYSQSTCGCWARWKYAFPLNGAKCCLHIIRSSCSTFRKTPLQPPSKRPSLSRLEGRQWLSWPILSGVARTNDQGCWCGNQWLGSSNSRMLCGLPSSSKTDYSFRTMIIGTISIVYLAWLSAFRWSGTRITRIYCSQCWRWCRLCRELLSPLFLLLMSHQRW